MWIVTICGPTIAAFGFFIGSMPVFWVGTAICVLNLFLNFASDVMKLPILPAIFIVVAIPFFSTWYLGAAIGLAIYTAVEAVGDLLARWQGKQ
ncbi:MAG: hypothetical protein LJE68_12980 [Rhodobacter sp.]|nr:hypothetical protein [Rhodobacter sp.]